MTKQRAKVLTIIGLVFAIVGFIIGINLPDEAIHMNSQIGKAFLCSYIFWSLFWGIRIVYEPIMRFFPTIFYSGSNAFDILNKHLNMQLTLYLVILGVGNLVGALGGAIVKQIQMIITMIEPD